MSRTNYASSIDLMSFAGKLSLKINRFTRYDFIVLLPSIFFTTMAVLSTRASFAEVWSSNTRPTKSYAALLTKIIRN